MRNVFRLVGGCAVLSALCFAYAGASAEELTKNTAVAVEAKSVIHLREVEIAKALETQITMEFAETPLTEILDFLRDKLSVNIDIDQRELDANAVDKASPVTVNFRGTSTESALNRILEPLALKWTIRDQMLLITTPEKEAQLTSSRVYPLRKVLGQGGVVPAREVAKIIKTHIDRDRWNDEGPYSIDVIEGEKPVLVITQTYHGHVKIAKLLNDLREAGAVDATK